MIVTSRLNWLSLDGVLSLWRSVADSGLMGEVLSSLQTELLATLKGVELRSVKAHLQEAGQCQMVQPFRKEAIISDLKKYLYIFYIFYTAPHTLLKGITYSKLEGSGVWYMGGISPKASTIWRPCTQSYKSHKNVFMLLLWFHPIVPEDSGKQY